MQRITITIDDSLLNQLDSLVNTKQAKNRSAAVDSLLKSALSQNTVETAVILAAGKKDKLWSEKHNCIKPLAIIESKATGATPMSVIELLLKKLGEAGSKRVIIVVGYGGDQIMALLKDGKQFGLTIEYITDENNSGSAGALLLCRQKINKPFILAYSDVYCPDLNLLDLTKFHKENQTNGAICTLSLVNVKTPNVFGVAKLTGSKIVSFAEKPRAEAQSNLVNAGIAVCEPTIFDYVSKTPSSFEKELLPMLVEKEKLYGYIYSGKWMDVEL